MLALLILDTEAVGARSKVSLVSRVVAKLIDIAIVMLLAAVLPHPIGPLFGFVYSLTADGMRFWIFDSQSVGKKLMGLQVRSLTRGEPASVKESVLRNAPVGVATFFAIIPIWGWLILALIGLPLMAMEIYLMITVETGHRLGDVMGDTEVVEAASAKESRKAS